VYGVVYQAREFVFCGRKLHFACFDLGEVEDFVDDAEEVVA
jgi:hypothetical protein